MEKEEYLFLVSRNTNWNNYNPQQYLATPLIGIDPMISISHYRDTFLSMSVAVLFIIEMGNSIDGYQLMNKSCKYGIFTYWNNIYLLRKIKL